MMNSRPGPEVQGWGYHYHQRTIGKKKILFRIAGILLILGGTISVLNGLLVFLVGYQIDSYETPLIIRFCAITTIALGIVSIGGGRVTARGYSWKLSVVIALVCICSVGFYFLASACGIFALILILVGKERTQYIPIGYGYHY